MSDPLPDSPARPSRPTLAPKATASGRPVLPGANAASSQVESESKVIESVIPEPLPPAPPPRPPVMTPWWAGIAARQTLLPPMAVLTLGLAWLGIDYFRQPADSALRTLPAAFFWAALALSAIAAIGTAALWVSIRRR